MAPAAVAQQAARVADVHVERVAADHEPLHQQHAGPVGDQAVALHLAQPQAALAAAPLRRLSGQHGPRTPRPAVHLVQDHVLQLLVVDRAVVDVRLQALASQARGQGVFALGETLKLFYNPSPPAQS